MRIAQNVDMQLHSHDLKWLETYCIWPEGSSLDCQSLINCRTLQFSWSPLERTLEGGDGAPNMALPFPSHYNFPNAPNIIISHCSLQNCVHSLPRNSDIEYFATFNAKSKESKPSVLSRRPSIDEMWKEQCSSIPASSIYQPEIQFSLAGWVELGWCGQSKAIY